MKGNVQLRIERLRYNNNEVMITGITEEQWDRFKRIVFYGDDAGVIKLLPPVYDKEDMCTIELITCTEADSPLNIWAGYVSYQCNQRHIENHMIINRSVLEEWVVSEDGLIQFTHTLPLNAEFGKFDRDLLKKIKQAWDEFICPVENVPDC